jgi:CBS domain-containing protein
MSLFDGLQEEDAGAGLEELDLPRPYGSQFAEAYAAAGLFRGFALIRSGEHKDTVDLKHNGVVPIVDLARMYALEGAITARQHP